MTNVSTQPARGMRDFLPADVRRREYVIARIKEVYERYGFEPLETPAVENIETLMGKYGEEGNQLIFKILKRGEGEASGQADLALRYDLTVPLARVVAEYGERLPRVFRRYQIQPVWRADRPARGRFREFYQCDVDVIGSRSVIVETELIAAVCDVLAKLGFADFTIKLNHRQALEGMLTASGLSKEKHADALTALDKLDKIGTDGVEKEFQARGIPEEDGADLIGIYKRIKSSFEQLGNHPQWNEIALTEMAQFIGGSSDELAEAVMVLLAEALSATNDSERKSLYEEVHGRLIELAGDNEAGAKGIEELYSLVRLASDTGTGHHIKVDPSLARGLSYYTGAIMEVAHPDLAGSLGGGGRYDGLVGMFSGKQVPACGFSIGLERIIVVMTERGMFPETVERAAADALVTVWDADSTSDALALARLLRDGGVRTEVYAEAGKIKNQLKYASARGVRFVVLAGPDERARGEVSIKDLRTGEQQTIDRETAAIHLTGAV